MLLILLFFTIVKLFLFTPPRQVPSDFAWQRGYSWYPDTPGAYPDSKWSWCAVSCCAVVAVVVLPPTTVIAVSLACTAVTLARPDSKWSWCAGDKDTR